MLPPWSLSQPIIDGELNSSVHEELATIANRFEPSYIETPPWDIGRPQPAIKGLADSGEISGVVLDVGCGTGENVLYLRERAFDAVGIDGAPTAIAKARAKAKARGLSARFDVADALDLPIPPRPYDTVIDSGLFHVFSDDERIRFRESLARVIRPGGTYFMMCFSEHEPGNWGPRRVTQTEIRSTFSGDWSIHDIRPSSFDTNIGQMNAWLATISWTGRKSARP